MPSNHKVLAFVMAGGEGSRLHPLTASRCKPAVPFNGKHRIVDFVLSNLVNSEIDQQRITGFQEKPRETRPMPGSSTHALASMGNYIFNADVLLQALRRMHESGDTDFGKHILPSLVRSHKLVAYDFDTNSIPGTEPYEEHAYWRDVGTIDSYFDAHFDTLGATPKFRMTNSRWPIYASPDQAESARIENGVINRSVVGSGCVVDGATLDHAMLRRSVLVEHGARLEHCIVMERSRIGTGALVRRAIIDQDNDVPPQERIGFDLVQDRKRFQVTDSGIVVVPAGYFPPRATANPFLSLPPAGPGADGMPRIEVLT